MRNGSPWELWTLNFQVMTALLADVEPRIRALHLEMKEFLLLTELDAHPNPAELARVLMTPKPTVTFWIKRLEAAGYLEREVDADDLRRFHLTMTAAGRRAMESAKEILSEEFSKRLGRLTQAQRLELSRILERMV